MLAVDGLKISINRGDTGSITVTFTGQDTPPDGTIARVSLMKTLGSETPLWAKRLAVSSGRVTIPLFTEDSDYAYGTYYWLLRLLYENGDVYTPMEKPAEFRITPSDANPTGGDGGA